MPPSIVVIGSSNTDLVARADRLPAPGETILAHEFSMVAGGKGANQAVAAARLGGRVTFIGRFGLDTFGEHALRGLHEEGVNTDYAIRDPDAPGGIAMICVNSLTGENSIVVAPGANGRLSPADIDDAEAAIRSAAIVVAQLEVPVDAVRRGFEIAVDAGVTTLLNPAPAQPLPTEILRMTSILTPNETEAAILAPGTMEFSEAATVLRQFGADTVVVTLGAMGAYVDSEEWTGAVPGNFVENVIDTTAAGDCFTGALAMAVAEGARLREAVMFANAAAALSVTRAGAQPSLPTRNQIDGVLSH